MLMDGWPVLLRIGFQGLFKRLALSIVSVQVLNSFRKPLIVTVLADACLCVSIYLRGLCSTI